MAINKVVYGNSTLIDLTEDTVSANNLLAGETAHDRSGASIVGSVVTAEVVDNLTTQDATKALSANQGYVLNQNKVDKVTGKGLSTNDYTNEDKTKVTSSDSKITNYEDRGYLGKNLLNPENMGHYGRDATTGEINGTYSNYSSTTNVIRVEPSTAYIITRNATEYGCRVFFYDADKNHIRNVVNYNNGRFTTPSNCYYIAFQCGYVNGALDLWCMTEGNSTTYVPYVKSNIELDATKIDKTASEIQTSDGQFDTVTGGLMQSCDIELDPIQDLHGYSKPWTGGGGKNKLPNNATTQTINGITWTVEKDADGNVIGVDANGTATAESHYYFYGFAQALNPLGQITDGMILSGCPSGGGTNSYYMVAGSLSSRYATDSGYSDTLSNVLQDGIRIICRIINGYTANHVKFKPMIRKATDSATFEPYSNICPISGHTQVQVGNVGKNILDHTYPTTTSNGITCTNNGDGTYTLNGTATADAIFILKDKESLSAIYEPHKSSEMKLLGCPSGGSDSKYRLQISRNNGSLIDTGNGVTIPSNAFASSTFWNLLIVVYSGQVLNNLVFKPMLTKDLSATYSTFEPYNGYTTTINLGGTYYGGTLDAVSGVLTVTHKLVDMGDLTYNYNATENIFGTAIISDMAEPVATKVQLMCSVLNAITPKDITGIANADDNSIAFNSSSSKFMRIKCTSYTDGNALKSAMTGQKIAYELATPQTIQLDPQTLETLVGQNDVFAPLDGQSVEEVEFREVLSIDDVIDAIPYENVAPDVGTGETHTYFRIHRYGRVVVFTFLQDSMIEIVEQATRKIFGVLPERFYTKVSGAMPYNTIKYTFINQNRFGVFVPKLLEIDPSNGNVYADYEADEGICPMGSLTYILDHD